MVAMNAPAVYPLLDTMDDEQRELAYQFGRVVLARHALTGEYGPARIVDAYDVVTTGGARLRRYEHAPCLPEGDLVAMDPERSQSLLSRGKTRLDAIETSVRICPHCGNPLEPQKHNLVCVYGCGAFATSRESY